MDSIYRIKTNIGDSNFDAEGPTEIVQADFQAWRELAAARLASRPPQPQPEASPTDSQPLIAIPKPDMAAIDASINKIMKVEDRIVSLTVRPKSADDAVLLILYGQKMLRSNDSVTGAEVLAGVVATGGLAVSRVDRMLENAEGDVIVTGERRAKRYRLTNAGLQKARAMANELISIVA